MKFGRHRLRCCRGQFVWNCWRMDDGRMMTEEGAFLSYKLPRSLWLGWAEHFTYSLGWLYTIFILVFANFQEIRSSGSSVGHVFACSFIHPRLESGRRNSLKLVYCTQLFKITLLVSWNELRYSCEGHKIKNLGPVVLEKIFVTVQIWLTFVKDQRISFIYVYSFSWLDLPTFIQCTFAVDCIYWFLS